MSGVKWTVFETFFRIGSGISFEGLLASSKQASENHVILGMISLTQH